MPRRAGRGTRPGRCRLRRRGVVAGNAAAAEIRRSSASDALYARILHAPSPEDRRLVLARTLVVLVVGFLVYVQLDGIPHYPVEKVTFGADPTPGAHRPRKEARQHPLRQLPPRPDHASSSPASGWYDAPAEFGVIYSPNITRSSDQGHRQLDRRRAGLPPPHRREARRPVHAAVHGEAPPPLGRGPGVDHRLPPLGRPDGRAPRTRIRPASPSRRSSPSSSATPSSRSSPTPTIRSPPLR